MSLGRHIDIGFFMKPNGGSRHIRFALIIFVGLVIFSLAQLSWWIIFQMDLNKRLYDYRVDCTTTVSIC